MGCTDVGNEYELLRQEITAQPLDLGQQLHGGTVVAWGYYNDNYLSVLLLLDESYRVPNEVNYLVGLIDLNTFAIQSPSTYPNIIPAVEAYARDYNMAL